MSCRCRGRPVLLFTEETGCTLCPRLCNFCTGEGDGVMSFRGDPPHLLLARPDRDGVCFRPNTARLSDRGRSRRASVPTIEWETYIVESDTVRSIRSSLEHTAVRVHPPACIARGTLSNHFLWQCSKSDPTDHLVSLCLRYLTIYRRESGQFRRLDDSEKGDVPCLSGADG